MFQIEHFENKLISKLFRDDFDHFAYNQQMKDGSIYTGQVDKDHTDLQHGYGYSSWSNGEEYTGEWKIGVIHGTGEYKWHDGSNYIGEWVETMMEGTGKYTWASGTTYLGQWE